MKAKVNLYSFLLILMMSGISCKKEGVEVLPQVLKSEDFLNVSYGENPRNKLDIYLPDQRDRGTPVILLVHGGSWVEGDKSAFSDLAKYWRARGYVAASMNYRLTHTSENNIHPAQVNDIRKAIDFLESKSGEWHFSGSKFALQGASAGGHLSLLYAYKYEPNARVKAVISMAGPTDLSLIHKGSPSLTEVVGWLIGKPYNIDPSAYAEASPITHVTISSPPSLLIHGKLDLLVPYQQAESLKERLDSKNAKSKLILYPDTGHEVLNLNNTAAFLAECEKWFEAYLN